tara:strand:+ start:1488 stop:1631 length:144 start_codon:yes stop_codon:yes gene_type:complete
MGKSKRGLLWHDTITQSFELLVTGEPNRGVCDMPHWEAHHPLNEMGG